VERQVTLAVQSVNEVPEVEATSLPFHVSKDWPGWGVDGTVYALARSPDGRMIYLGGAFETVDGLACRNVCRYDTVLQRVFPLGTEKRNGVSGTVKALEVGPEGDVWVGGLFASVSDRLAGVSPARNVARWLTTQERWDMLGDETANGVDTTGATTPGVHALARMTNGLVCVGGGFVAVADPTGGTRSASHFAVWNPATRTWSLPGGTDAPVLAVECGPQGQVAIGGEFGYTISATGGSSPAQRVALWEPSSSTWSALGSESANGTSARVRALAFASTGNLYVGGDFLEVRDGVAGARPARLVACWNPAGFWSELPGVNAIPSGNRQVSTLRLAANGDVLLGGLSLDPHRVRLATATWERVGGDNAPFFNIHAIEPGDGETLWLAGALYSHYVLTDGTMPGNFVQWDGTDWRSMLQGSPSGPDGPVYTLCAVGDQLYAGGSFVSAGGVKANNIARFDRRLRRWFPLGSATSNGLGNSPQRVGTIRAHPNGTLLVGGDFASGRDERGWQILPNFAVWDPATSHWSALDEDLANSMIPNPDLTPRVSVDSFGRWLIGAQTTELRFSSGPDLQGNGVYRFDPFRPGWHAFPRTTAFDSICTQDLLPLPGGSFLVGGIVGAAQFSPVVDRAVARRSFATGLWDDLGLPPLNPDSQCSQAFALSPARDGSLFANNEYDASWAEALPGATQWTRTMDYFYPGSALAAARDLADNLVLVGSFTGASIYPAEILEPFALRRQDTREWEAVPGWDSRARQEKSSLYALARTPDGVLYAGGHSLPGEFSSKTGPEFGEARRRLSALPGQAVNFSGKALDPEGTTNVMTVVVLRQGLPFGVVTHQAAAGDFEWTHPGVQIADTGELLVVATDAAGLSATGRLDLVVLHEAQASLEVRDAAGVPVTARVDLGVVLPGAEQTREFRLHNLGSLPVPVGGAYVQSSTTAGWRISPQFAADTVIPPGGHATFSVAFRPTVSGTSRAWVNFDHDLVGTLPPLELEANYLPPQLALAAPPRVAPPSSGRQTLGNVAPGGSDFTLLFFDGTEYRPSLSTNGWTLSQAPPERPIPKRRRARGTAPIAAVHILWSAVKAGTPARHRFHWRPAPGYGPNGSCQSGCRRQSCVHPGPRGRRPAQRVVRGGRRGIAHGRVVRRGGYPVPADPPARHRRGRGVHGAGGDPLRPLGQRAA
jgi:hypothetical protein